MANFTLPSFPRSPRPAPPRDALAAAVAELKARLDAASVSFPRLSSAAGLHLVDSYADALALVASLADGDVVLVGGTSWYYVESHSLVPFDPSGADARLAALEAKVPPEASPSNQLADRAYIATALAEIVGGAPEAYDTLKEIADWIADDESGAAKIVADVLALRSGKQDAIADLAAIRAGAAKGATAVQDVSGKRDKTDFSAGDGWLLVKPDGALAWLVKSDPQQSTWTGDGFVLTYGESEGEVLWNFHDSYVSVADDSADLPSDANRLEFTGADGSSVYRLVRGSRLALDTEIPPAQVNADWNATDGVAQILNKPEIPVVPTPIAPSTEVSAKGKPADAKDTGDALEGKRGLTDLAVYGSAWVLSVPGGGTFNLVKPFPSANQWQTGESVGDYAILHAPLRPEWSLLTMGQSGTPELISTVMVLDEDSDAVESLDFGQGYTARLQAVLGGDSLAKTSLVASKQDALSAEQLANIAAVPGKADAADLRYRIAEAAVRKTLPADCFPVTFTNDGVSYSVNSLVKESEASAAGDMFIVVNENDYPLAMVESPATGSELMALIEVATFSAGGVFVTGIQDLQFGGVSPVADTSPTLADIQILADRAVNLVTAGSGTASIDIELPELANVGRMRDFYVRLTVSATSASTWTIGQGESWDAMGSPPSSFAAGTYLYHISEVAAGVWHAEDMFAVAGKMPMYPMVPVTPSNGTLTVTPYTVATYTAGDSAAAFTVAVGTGTTGMARDCELVIDCTATGAVAPTVTWPATFHPRTDAATDFACEAGKRNAYFISEFASGEYAVGGWQETAGGNA